MKRSEIRPLTSLRFVAAFWVVAYHYLTPALLAHDAPGWLVTFSAAGFVGVPVFFVLSGFVLSYNYDGQDLRAPAARRAFWAARFARVYPLYIVAFLLSVPPALYALWTGVPGLPSVRDHAVGAILSPLLLQAWAGSAYEAWNTPGWTLSVEAAFYAAFPWMVSGPRSRLPRLLAVASAVSALLLTLHVTGALPSVAFATRNPIVHVPSFLAGAWLARQLPHIRALRPAQSDALTLAGFACLGTVVAALMGPWGPRPEVGNPLLNAILLVPAVALMVVGLAAPVGRLVGWLSAPLLVVLGNISYGVYILQSPVARYVVHFPASVLGFSPASYVAFAWLSVVLLGVSWLAYERLERPAQRWLRARLSQPRPSPAREPAPAPAAD